MIRETWWFLSRCGLLPVDAVVLEHPPRKRSLADRLGRAVEDEEPTGLHLRNGQSKRLADLPSSGHLGVVLGAL